MIKALEKWLCQIIDNLTFEIQSRCSCLMKENETKRMAMIALHLGYQPSDYEKIMKGEK